MNAKRDGFDKLTGAVFFSPKDFVRHAVLIVVLFGVVHWLGWREYTAMISGTMASPDLGAETCTLLAIIYMLFYFGAVVFAPILLIAAGLLVVWGKIVRTNVDNKDACHSIKLRLRNWMGEARPHPSPLPQERG